METILKKITDRFSFCRYAAEEDATALIETVILMPVMISLLMGCFDLGQGILMNQKTIGASQIIGDLITRDKTVTMGRLEDMITAGEMAFEPYSTATFGYDIASVEFDEDGEPVVLWRVTENMEPNDDAVASTEIIGEPGAGVVVVTSIYKYTPFFSHFVVDEINMKEVAFLRGRLSATVACNDCPEG